MSKSKINNKKRVKQSGGQGGPDGEQMAALLARGEMAQQGFASSEDTRTGISALKRNSTSNFKNNRAGLKKTTAVEAAAAAWTAEAVGRWIGERISFPVSKKTAPLAEKVFNVLDYISKYKEYISIIIRYPSYFINIFGLIIVAFIVILMLMTPIVMFIKTVLERPEWANKITSGMYKAMTIIPSDYLYIIISVLKTILAALLIAVFCIRGQSILEAVNKTSLMSAFFIIMLHNLYIFHGVLGILFTIGLFLGFYNLSCIKELEVKRYSGNVGDFITSPIMIITIIFALFGLVLTQCFKATNFDNLALGDKFIATIKKTVIFFTLFLFLYLFILICNHISNIVGDATTKFMFILGGGTTCTGIDDDCDKTDESIKCSFEESGGSDKQDSEFIKRLKGMLTTLFMFFIMTVVVLSSPFDKIIKINTILNEIIKKLSEPMGSIGAELLDFRL